MNFIKEIKKIENEIRDNEEIVINEIINYFTEKLYSESFEEYLKKTIKNKIIENKTILDLKVEFWNYHEGCSPTHFQCACYEFKLDYGKYDYKGITLYNIQEKVGQQLTKILKIRLLELGLSIFNEKREINKRFDYYENYITIKW